MAADLLIASALTIAVFAAAWLLSRVVSSAAQRWQAAEKDTLARATIPWIWRLLMLLSSPLALWLGPRVSIDLREHLQRELRVAEFDDWLSPQQFLAVCLLSPLLAATLSFLAGASATLMLLVTIGVASLPWGWLRGTANQQRIEVARELPMYLDMLTLSLEAGGALSVALKITTERSPESLLKRAFLRVQGDLRAGRSRGEALRALAERLDSPAVSALVAALIQADSSGGSLADVLRAQSEQRLEERFARAEKAAMEAPVKMLGPLVLCIFPCTFIVLAAPIVLRFIDLSPQ